MANVITTERRLALTFGTNVGKRSTRSFSYSKDADTIDGGDVKDLMDLMVEKTAVFTTTYTESVKAEIISTKTTVLDLG